MQQFSTHIIRLSLIVLGLLSCFQLQSADGISMPDVKKTKRHSDFPDPIPQGDLNRITIPIKRAGNLLLLEVRIDSIVGNLILDTGAPHLVLNSTYFRNYPKYGSIVAAGITGGGGEGSQTQIGRMDVAPGLFYTKVDADVVPLGHLESKKGVKILGLFGLNLLKRMEIHFHIRDNEIVLYRLTRNGERLYKDDAEQLQTAIKPLRISQENGLLLMDAQINEKHLLFYLDSGAETNILHSGCSKKVFDKVSITKRSMLSGVGQSQVEVLQGDLSELTVNGMVFKDVGVTVMNLNSMRTAYDVSIDGMLGYGFLAQRSIGINFIKGALYIWD